MNIKHIVPRWLPALLTMAAIFWFSAQPNYKLPEFDWADRIVKKGGHMLGYAALAISYWYGLRMKNEKRWLAWTLAILYAVSDEYHQSFVIGRHASVWDVLIFDDLGALVGLWVMKKSSARYTRHGH
jgi:VanZ family protein